jgi:hypothetical protein
LGLRENRGPGLRWGHEFAGIANGDMGSSQRIGPDCWSRLAKLHRQRYG